MYVGRCAGLRIPMRGYEFFAQTGGTGQAGRYESPCGVMRLDDDTRQSPARALRIPMRGYEKLSGIRQLQEGQLRIPMRGYELCMIGTSATFGGLRIPMRGYER